MAMIRSLALPAAALVLAGSVALAHPPQHHAPAKAQPAPAAKAQGSGGQRAPAGAPGARNLKVFPQNIPQERLMAAMVGFSRALGVECSHCHVSGNFASDENPHKDAARGMMRMTAQINRELLPAIPSLHGGQVTCSTCHRGQTTPATALPGDDEPPRAHIAPDTPARPH